MHSNAQKISPTTYRTLFWLFLAGITAFRLLLADKFGLGVDESHYVLFSRRLAWGYFDHPPMVAFLAAGTTLAGNSVFWVRLGPIICSVLGVILMRYLALGLYRDERVAFWAAVLLNLMPYQHLLMVALLPDATLNFFWCGTLLTFWYALKNGKWPLWILAGLLFGGALLSKYHAVLLPLCLVGYLLTSSNHRFWLGRIQPYVAGLTGLAVFMPNILWNARHGWISYAYQLGRGSGDGLNFGKFLLAIGGQFGVWSPLIFGLLIAAVITILRSQRLSDSDRFVVWTSIPVFAFFCLAGLTSKILPHWTAVGWWTGSIAIAVVALRKISQPNKSGVRWRRWSVAAGVTGFLMSVLLHAALMRPIVGPAYTWARDISLSLNRHFPAFRPLKPFETGYDISNDLFGWEEIAKRVEAVRAGMPRPQQTFVFCRRFFMTSQLGVYLSPDTVATSLHRKVNQYHLWFSAEGHKGWDALFVVDHKRHRERAQGYQVLFAAMDPDPVEIRVYRGRQLAHDFDVYKYYGFKGRFEE
jgi:hypothetical protein